MGKKVKTADKNDSKLVKAATPLPKLQVFCICSVQMAEAMNVDLLFPFLAFMVEDMGYTGESLGYHAGILAASFCGAQFCTSVAWGMISDRYGRKFAIVSGTLGAGLGMLIFGFAKTFPQAVLGRIVGGLLCGNLGVVKSFLTEITDDTNRSGAFYLFSLSWAVGSVFAPLVGGMLCSPAEKFPTVFPDHPKSLFVEYPYLFPCLITVSINVIAALLCMLFMVETVGSKKDDPERGGALFSDDNTVGTDESHHSLLEEGIELPPLHRKLSASGGYDRVPISTLDYEVTQVNPLQIAVETKYDTILEFEESTFDNPGAPELEVPKLQFALGGQHSPVQGASSALSTSIRQVRQRSLSSTVAPYSSSAFAVTGNSSSTNISDGAYSALGGGGGGIRQRSLSSSVAPYNSGAFSLPGHSSASSSSSALGSSIYRDQENVHNNSSTDGGEGGGNCGGDIEQDMTFGSNSRVYRDVPVTVNININDDTDDDTDDEEDGGDGAKDGGGDVEAGGGGDAEEVDPADEAVCCPSLFDRLAALAACLSCTAKSRSLDASHSGSANHSKGGGGSGGAMDSSKHGLLEEGESSKQLINAASSADHRSDASQSGTHSDANSPPAPPLSTSTVLTQRVVVLATLNYGMICASSILMDETLPLFLKAPASEGGFGFTSAEIGMLLSIGAGGMMALTMLTMPLTNGVSNKWISKFSLAVSIPLVLAFPAIALLNNQVFAHIRSNTERLWLLWPVLIIVNTVKNLFTCMAFTSAILMVNHSVTDEYLGAVNGLGQSLGALARSLGPAVGGLLWSVGTRYNFAYFNFIATTLLYLLNYYVSHLVPKSLDHRKKPKGNKLK